jgi:hypothetical protein
MTLSMRILLILLLILILIFFYFTTQLIIIIGMVFLKPVHIEFYLFEITYSKQLSQF